MNSLSAYFLFGVIAGAVLALVVCTITFGQSERELRIQLRLEQRYSDWITNRAVNAETRLREIEKEKP